MTRPLSGVLALALLLACGACSKSDNPAPVADMGAQDMAVADDLGADMGAPEDLGVDLGERDMGEPLLDPEALSTPAEAYEAVNPFIGAGGRGFGYAGLTPAAQAPLGFVKLGPDTTRAGNHPAQQHFSGYYDTDPHTRGFSHTHFVGTGVADYGNLRVLPVRALDEADQRPWRAWTTLDKASERAAPGYYEAELPDERVHAAMSADSWAGHHRYTAREAGRVWLLLNGATSVTDEPERNLDTQLTISGDTVEGYHTYRGGYTGRRNPFTLYYSIKLSRPADEAFVWEADGFKRGQLTGSGERVGAVLGFDAAAGEAVALRVGVSLISLDNARAHRQAQAADDQSLDAMRQRVRAQWEAKLAKVRVAGGRASDREKFFTALYNTYRMPTRLHELDGRYMGLDAQAHEASGFVYVSDLSLWDTFRTLHPWWVLVDQEAQRDALKSLMQMGADTGTIPRWPAALSTTGGMIGTSADVVFADSALKGVEGIDYDAALDLLLLTANGQAPEGAPFQGRDDMDSYLQYGYIPAEIEDETVSRTLEYAYHDWALSNLARHLGREALADELLIRSRAAWQALYDPASGFFMPKTQDGAFIQGIRPTVHYQRSGPFTEGNAWQWLFYVPQDPEGLRELIGAEAFLQRLQKFFEDSELAEDEPNLLLYDTYYWHGNEPCLHAPMLFHAAGRSDLAYLWTRQAQEKLYTTRPDGLPGNDDGGTLSAWYLFTAMGLYPIAGGDTYHLTPPIFTRAEVQLSADKTLTIAAPDARPERWHVSGLSRDGQPHTTPSITHAELLQTQTLTYTMMAAP